MSQKKFNKKIKIFSNSNLFFCNINKNSFLMLQIKNLLIKYIIVPNFILVRKEQNFLVLTFNNTNTIANHLFLANKFSLFLASWLKSLKKPFRKKLVLKGLGLRATFSDDERGLKLKLGYSHFINVFIPVNEVSIYINKNFITIEGFDRVQVGNFADYLRNLRVPDSYKGKGIWYKNEIRVLKEVKKT